MTNNTTFDTTIPNLEELKARAKQLRAKFARQNKQISHSKALEIIAHRLGFKDWNTLHALSRGSNHSAPLCAGNRLSGYYLHQPIKATILRVQPKDDGEHFQLVLSFDEPVDVVTFNSFSSYRRQISCIVDHKGKSEAHTSDGAPHLQLAL